MAIKLSDKFTYKKIIRFTMPSIFMILFSSIYGVVDGYFVSNLIGSEAFASVNLIWPFEMILGSFGMMIGTGGSALVSKTLGEKENKKANEYFSLLLYFLILIGIIFSILGIMFTKNIILLFDIDNKTRSMSLIYANALFLFIPFFILQNTFQSFLVVAEKPEMGLITTIISGVTNLVLDYMFIKIFNLNIFGAALATGISQMMGGIIPLLYFIFNKNSNLRLGKTHYSLNVIVKSSINGASEMFSNLSYSFISILYNFTLINLYGIAGVSAYGVIMYIGYMFMAVFFGYPIGISPVISYNYGAKNNEELKNIFKKSIMIIFSFSIVLTCLSFFLSRPLSNIFVGYDEYLLDLTSHGMRIFIMSYLLAGYNIFSSSLFTALNDGFTSSVISIFRTFIFQVLCIIVIPKIFGSEGIWLSVIFSEALSLFMCIYFILLNNKKYGYM